MYTLGSLNKAKMIKRKVGGPLIARFTGSRFSRIARALPMALAKTKGGLKPRIKKFKIKSKINRQGQRRRPAIPTQIYNTPVPMQAVVPVAPSSALMAQPMYGAPEPRSMALPNFTMPATEFDSTVDSFQVPNIVEPSYQLSFEDGAVPSEDGNSDYFENYYDEDYDEDAGYGMFSEEDPVDDVLDGLGFHGRKSRIRNARLHRYLRNVESRSTYGDGLDGLGVAPALLAFGQQALQAAQQRIQSRLEKKAMKNAVKNYNPPAPIETGFYGIPKWMIIGGAAILGIGAIVYLKKR